MIHRDRARSVAGRFVVAAAAASGLGAAVAHAQTGTTTFVYEALASLGDPAPGGGIFAGYFELGGLNNEETLAIAAGVTSDGSPDLGEAVVLFGRHQLTLVARSQQVAPGGSVFGVGTLFPMALNDAGDLVFSFSLDPFDLPLESTAGLFLQAHNAPQLAALVLPDTSTEISGVGLGPALNNQGSVAFSGLVPATSGPGSDFGVGSGVFVRDKAGNIRTIARPGDPAPGGSVYDWVAYPSINKGGDVSFAGHRANQSACPPPSPDLFCFDTALYIADHSTGLLSVVASPGDVAPDGGVFTLAAFGRVNARGDVAFLGRTSSHPAQFSAFVRIDDETRRVAVVGDPAPGGGHFLRLGPASTGTNPIHISDSGVVSFLALLDSDVDGDGRPDTGAFQWRDGAVTVIARTGTAVGDLGTVRDVRRSDIAANNRGDAAFWSRLADGREVVLLARGHP